MHHEMTVKTYSIFIYSCEFSGSVEDVAKNAVKEKCRRFGLLIQLMLIVIIQLLAVNNKKKQYFHC